MTTDLALFRRFLLAAAALLLALALILVLGVIPPVLVDTFPQAAPQRAAAAFRVHAALDVLAALALIFLSTRTIARSRRAYLVLGFMAVVILLLGAAITDAAFAFPAHGPALHFASQLLIGCVAAAFLAAACVVAAVYFLPKQT